MIKIFCIGRKGYTAKVNILFWSTMFFASKKFLPYFRMKTCFNINIYQVLCMWHICGKDISMCLIELHNGHTLTLNSLFTTTPTTFVTDRVNNIVIIQSNWHFRFRYSSQSFELFLTSFLFMGEWRCPLNVLYILFKNKAKY